MFISSNDAVLSDENRTGTQHDDSQRGESRGAAGWTASAMRCMGTC